MRVLFIVCLLALLSCNGREKNTKELEAQAKQIMDNRIKRIDSLVGLSLDEKERLITDSVRFIKYDSEGNNKQAVFFVSARHRQDTAKFLMDDQGNLVDNQDN